MKRVKQENAIEKYLRDDLEGRNGVFRVPLAKSALSVETVEVPIFCLWISFEL